MKGDKGVDTGKHRCQLLLLIQICRNYYTSKCEYDDLFLFEQYFETPEQIEEYANAILGPRPGDSFRTPKPSRNLPLL